MTAGVRALYLATERLSDADDRGVGDGPGPDDQLGRPDSPRWRRHPQRGRSEAGSRSIPRRGPGSERSWASAPTTTCLGVLGRLDPNKQFNLVIEAAAPLLDDSTKLLVVGNGAERSAPGRGGTHRCGVTGRVIFAGERHDVAAMLSAMDLFVASSAQETFGLSVLEALANGVPVLYTTCPALTGLEVSRARQVPSAVLPSASGRRWPTR